MTDKLKFDVADNVATITYNNPEKLNAFNTDMLKGHLERLKECHERDDVRVVILTGEGRGFCSGGDTGGMGGGNQPTPKEAKDNLANLIQPIALQMSRMDKPVIAAINGPAVGAGLDMALHCDLRYAAKGAKMGETYVKMGLVPGNGAAYFLPRIVGMPKALELLWTAKLLTAEEALDCGLVNGVFEAEGFLDSVKAVAKEIAANAPISVQYIKRLAYAARDMDIQTHMDMVSSHMIVARTSEDHVEALDAFRKKRTPTFKGH